MATVERTCVRKYGRGWRAVAVVGGRQRTRKLSATGIRAARAEAREWAASIESEETDEKRAQAASQGGRGVCEYIEAGIGHMLASGSIERSTYLDYRNSLGRIRRCLGGVALADLTPQMVRGMEVKLAKDGLSASAVRKAHGLLKQMCSMAVCDGIIGRNPADAVKKPKNVKTNHGSNSMASSERARLLDALAAEPDTPTSVAARVSLWTGLRRGEVCGLRWADVDWDGRLIWVRRAIGFGAGGHYVKMSKTDSVRSVAMPKDLSQLLSLWHTQQGCPKVSTYVLSGTSEFYDPQLAGKHWREISDRLDLTGTEGRRVTFHDLRHTWATMAVAAGVDIKTVASNLGHANAAMTLNIYASADPDAKRRAADVIQLAMRGTPPAE